MTHYPLQLSGLRAQSFSLEGGRSAIDYYEDDDDDDEDDDYIPDTETGTQNEFHLISEFLVPVVLSYITLILMALKCVLSLVHTSRGKDRDWRILIHHHFPVHIRDIHKWNAHLHLPLGCTVLHLASTAQPRWAYRNGIKC